MQKPNFFIVGAPKCGTTALYRYLDDHPQVLLSDPKEVNYFSKPELEEQNLYYQDFKPKDEKDYLKLFRAVNNTTKIIGEASVSYLYYPKVAERIYRFNPESKIVILLRDPVSRAWSHYLMDRRLGLVKKEFIEIFHSEMDEDKLNFQQYFLLGIYSEQIKRYTELFGLKNVKVILSDDLKSNTKLVIADLYDFLGIEHIDFGNSKTYNTYKEANNKLIKSLYTSHFFRKTAKRIIPRIILNKISNTFFETNSPKLEGNFRTTLKKYYNKEICNLESLLSRDLSEWK